ncbi:hypothetical protein A1Q2_07122 [Trichosporon asahii var. asahii CBS 8904]|uniref:Uncharacterized protein n=1 Tax=Trichosporon asahii var. asahii (strain CBS 8904) TaxID=1220162 RepID=K1VHD3_TRIAC|nr:hypothetical protein A1Q2_07122 [Trichosporon asahii var. asahii CBS 8904]
MREDELDRLKAKRDRALKAIPMDTTPSVPPKSPPPSRPRRPISPPSAYPLSPLMFTVVDTQIPLRSPSRSETVETLDAAVDFTRAARLARAPSVTSITSSVAHSDRKASMTRTPPTTAPSSPTMSDIPLSPMSSFSAGDTRAAARAKVFNSVLGVDVEVLVIILSLLINSFQHYIWLGSIVVMDQRNDAEQALQALRLRLLAILAQEEGGPQSDEADSRLHCLYCSTPSRSCRAPHRQLPPSAARLRHAQYCILQACVSPTIRTPLMTENGIMKCPEPHEYLRPEKWTTKFPPEQAWPAAPAANRSGGEENDAERRNALRAGSIDRHSRYTAPAHHHQPPHHQRIPGAHYLPPIPYRHYFPEDDANHIRDRRDHRGHRDHRRRREPLEPGEIREHRPPRPAPYHLPNDRNEPRNQPDRLQWRRNPHPGDYRPRNNHHAYEPRDHYRPPPWDERNVPHARHPPATTSATANAVMATTTGATANTVPAAKVRVAAPLPPPATTIAADFS